MARRKNIGVSLFSFQDIITSVTAIIILVLLLLTVELLFRKYGLAASDVVRTQVELAKVESQLNEQVQSFEDSIAKARSDESSAVTPTKSELRRQLSSLESKQRKAGQERLDANQVLAAAERKKQNSLLELGSHQGDRERVKRLEQEAEEKKKQLEELKEANKLKKEKLEKLKEQVQDDKGSALELVFKRPKNGHEQPWLLVLHEDGLAYLKLGSGITEKLALASKKSSVELNDWLASLSYGDNYILLLIRPSGIQHQGWVMQAIGNAKLPVGVELIGEDQDVQDGSVKDND